jgi:hypothetical protein
MDSNNKMRPYLIRLGIVLAISVLVVFAFNEISYRIQKDEHDRAPETVSLVIPEGTAASIENGEDVPTIPSEMVFVLGDILEVENQDSVSHQLGPVWVSPDSTASLVMERANKFAYSCSFQTSRYLNLDVRLPTTVGTRFTGVALAAPTMTTLVFLYSLLVFPVDKAKKQ